MSPQKQPNPPLPKDSKRPKPPPAPPKKRASSGFYLGADGEYYYDDGRPFPHPFTAKGIITLCGGS